MILYGCSSPHQPSVWHFRHGGTSAVYRSERALPRSRNRRQAHQPGLSVWFLQTGLAGELLSFSTSKVEKVFRVGVPFA
jgi:hypothetical protein